MCVTSLLQALAVGCACGSVLIFCICIGQYATETFEQLVLDLPNDTCNAVAGLNFTSTLAPVTLEVTSFTDETSAPETSDFLNWFFSISYLWYRTIGVTVIILVGSILSLVAGACVCKTEDHCVHSRRSRVVLSCCRCSQNCRRSTPLPVCLLRVICWFG